MSKYLNENIQPKKKRSDNKKFSFKAKPASTISKPPQEVIQIPENPQQPQENEENQKPIDPVHQFHLENLDENPTDDMLINFLSQFNPAPQQAVPAQPVEQPLVCQEQVPNNTMNISNVSNVQNVNENKPQVPTMFF